MKKLPGIVLLAVMLIFSAGCISTAEDEIIGIWKYPEPISYGDYTEDCTITLTTDNHGTIIYEYSDGKRTEALISWEKTEDGYAIEEIPYFTLSENGKSLTDGSGRIFEPADGAELIGGKWSGRLSESTTAAYLFNEDGTGIYTHLEAGEEPDENPFCWTMADENRITLWYTYPYTADDVALTIDGNSVYEYTSQKTWTKVEEYYSDELVFYSDGTMQRCIYDAETGDKLDTTHYTWKEKNGAGFIVMKTPSGAALVSSTPESGDIIYHYTYSYILQENGKLLCTECGEVFEKLTP